VKRLLAAAAGLLGLAWWRNRAKPPEDDPAEDLRAKLAQARVAEDRDAFEAGEKPVDEVPDDVETRRNAVHERARQHAEDLDPE
jgi:hypothetical protein